MRRLLIALALLGTAIACWPAGAAASFEECEPDPAAFGFCRFEATFTDEDGLPTHRAGSHPFAMSTSLAGTVGSDGLPKGWLREFVGRQVAGLLGDTTAYETCSAADFLDTASGVNACPTETALGINTTATFPGTTWSTAPVFNLEPPPGVLLRIGFRAVVENVVVDVGVTQEAPYRPVAVSRNIPQLARIYANKLQLWGDPSDPRHDELRGTCGTRAITSGPSFEDIADFEFENVSGKTCPVAPKEKAFLTLPTDCSAPLFTEYDALSWTGEHDAGAAPPRGPAGEPQRFTECSSLDFEPEIEARPTTRAAGSPTGMDISLRVDDPGLTDPEGRSQSAIRKVVLELPEGMTANPSVAEGLEVCSEDQLDKETLDSAPGEGCPEASKLGTLEVESPLVEETIKGSLYQAAPFENPFDSLLALYFVLKSPELGIVVKQAAKVEADPETGQLVGITEEIPQLAFSEFRLHFREGGRSPLVSPPSCGSHEATATITPWSGGPEVQSTSTFTLISGPGEGPCPPGGTPPFEPGFTAGSVSNAAGSFSPFAMRLTRRDGDQDLVRFDATLPPGVLAKLTGVSRCTDAQIARADGKSGREELAAPSCPANSRIGTVFGGAGVGSQLTYVRGSLYLGGPFGGAPLSAVAIVPAVAGPFDIGNVVVRQALRVDPRTGVVTADGSRSDPIPHILQGIPLVVRDIQVYVDRPGFTLNPTSCDPMETLAGIWGGGANPFSLADNAPVARSARYQAAACASLPYKPRLSLRLKGGTKRGDHPALRTVFRPRPGDANSHRVVVRFPRSAFVEQAHIRTICTRVQFAADACPKGAIYGRVTAFTPLLANPLQGPVYLRSSDNELPDLVFDLKGEVDFEAVARIDSVKGALRAIAYGIPDAPIEKVVIRMQGGKKGLIVNSRNLCASTNRARLTFDAHNGKQTKVSPPVQARCGKARRSARGGLKLRG